MPQSAEEHRQSDESRNSSPPVSNSSKDCALFLCEKDTLTKFLESCDPPMLCWHEPLVAFGCEDLETLRLLVDCDKKHVILQQILDQACLNKVLTKVHVLFLLWNLGFPPAWFAVSKHSPLPSIYWQGFYFCSRPLVFAHSNILELLAFGSHTHSVYQ